VQFVGAALLVFRSPEIRQHVLEAPASIAELPPMVEILALAANIEQAVDRARPAQHFAARLDEPAVAHVGLRLGRIKPVHTGIVEQLAVAERNVNPDVAVAPAGFQEQHAVAARGGQPVGENAAGRTGADHDIVERLRWRILRHNQPIPTPPWAAAPVKEALSFRTFPSAATPPRNHSGRQQSRKI
jgi:hypothetical protein